jgi:hypothetical protein
MTRLLSQKPDFWPRKEKGSSGDRGSLAHFNPDRLFCGAIRGEFREPLFGRYRLHNRDVGSAIAFGRERNTTGTRCEQRVVTAEADIRTRMEFGAALAHEDLAAIDGLAAKALHAEALTRAVAPVTGAAACFFVSHEWTLEP